MDAFATSPIVKQLEKAPVKARNSKTKELLQGSRGGKASVGVESLGSGEWESRLSRMLSFEGAVF